MALRRLKPLHCDSDALRHVVEERGAPDAESGRGGLDGAVDHHVHPAWLAVLVVLVEGKQMMMMMMMRRRRRRRRRWFLPVLVAKVEQRKVSVPLPQQLHHLLVAQVGEEGPPALVLLPLLDEVGSEAAERISSVSLRANSS